MTIGFLIMTVFFLQGDQVGENWRTRQVCALAAGQGKAILSLSYDQYLRNEYGF